MINLTYNEYEDKYIITFKNTNKKIVWHGSRYYNLLKLIYETSINEFGKIDGRYDALQYKCVGEGGDLICGKSQVGKILQAQMTTVKIFHMLYAK